LEPEIILKQREYENFKSEKMSTPEDGIIIEFNSSQDSGINETLCQALGRTFR